MTPSTPPPPPPVSPDGMVSSTGAGREVDPARPRVFPCDGCGANLEFSIDVQSLRCPFCGHVKAIEVAAGAAVEEQDLRAALARVAAQRSDGDERIAGVQEVRCGDCGAEVRFVGTLTSDGCPYCGAAIQLDGVHEAEDRIKVDGVLPFQVPKDRARANLAAWVRSRWFAPNLFRRRGVEGRFQGVYLPFWTYDALTSNEYRGERGDHYWVTVRQGDKTTRVRKTRWSSASGSFRRFFDDVLVLAGRGLPRDLLDALDPWPLDGCMPFTPAVLAGHLARTYDLPLEEGFREAEQRIEAALRAEVRRRIGGDEQRIHDLRTGYGALSYKHLLLPVWLLAYKYHGKTYQVVVNAATGEVQGTRPYSWLKISLAVLAGLALAGGIYLLTQR
jgi:DNA-directed RNA polymerase subunit RPC12/RpoP